MDKIDEVILGLKTDIKNLKQAQYKKGIEIEQIQQQIDSLDYYKNQLERIQENKKQVQGVKNHE